MQTLDLWLKNNRGNFNQELKVLACHFLKITKAELITKGDETISVDLARHLSASLGCLKKGIPLAYILRKKEFWSFELEVDKNTLIPRPETELIVEKSIKLAKEKGTVLELGTGSAAIAIALAKERPDLQITATDISPAALRVAKRNLFRHRLLLNLVLSDWYSAISGKWDLIISNPPYIAENDPHLISLREEPKIALIAGPTGYEALHYIIDGAKNFLTAGAYVIVEHGYDQAKQVRERFNKRQFSKVYSYKDLAQIERITVAKN